MNELGFSPEQIERYSRQILLPELGGRGQRTLLHSRALVVGAGGLGSPALFYLAAAGVGTLGVIDSDVVELSNLQRQIIHRDQDQGCNKALCAARSIAELNPDCRVISYPSRLNVQNVREIIRGFDVVLDGSDNFPTRFLVADACFMEKIPLVSAAVLRFQGQLMTVIPGHGNPCYRCAFREPPPPGMIPSCQEAGVLGAAVGVMGTLQATEAIKVILGIGEILSHRLLVYDGLESEFFFVKRALDPDCPICGDHPSITDLVEADCSCGASPPTGGVG